jgi:hypothetical protein
MRTRQQTVCYNRLYVLTLDNIAYSFWTRVDVVGTE